jgi:DNA-binding NarL/FixJ family response regulator/predicted ATPase
MLGNYGLNEHTGDPWVPRGLGLVGREQERETLGRALDGLAEGTAQAVAVTGDPGMGKTFLLSFLAEQADQRGLTILAGRARESGRRVPFGVLIDALDDHLASLGPAGLERVGSEYLESLAMIFPALSWYEARSAGPALRAERYRLHVAVRALLERLAGPGIVLSLDDLHWADEESAQIAAYLSRRPPRAPVLLTLAYRDRQAPEWLRSAMVEPVADCLITHLKLGPLSEQEASLLAVPPGARQWRRVLYERSGGNPFYLLALAWSPTLRQGGHGPGTGEVPSTVEAVLLAELSALSAQGRLLAQAAAVADEPFDPEYAAAIGPLGSESVLQAVDELAERDLIRPVDGTREFMFRHPLVRQVAYRSAAPGWRLAAHGRAARALERRGAPTTARAHHVALTAMPGDLSAVELLTSAARETRIRAPATAAQWLRAALLLLPEDGDDPRRATLLLYLAESLGLAGHPRQSRDTVQEALRLLPREQAGIRARAVASCALIGRMLGQLGEARALLINEISALPDQEAIEAGILKFELACAELAALDGAAAGEWAAQALATANCHQARPLEAAALGAITMACIFREDVPAAAASLRDAQAALDGLLDSELARRLDAVLWVGLSEVHLDQPASALRHLDRALGLARSSGQGMVLPYLLAVQVLVLRSTGRLADASACAEDAVDLALLTDSEELRAFALAMRCWVSAWTGDFHDALSAGNAAAGRLDRGVSDWSAALAVRMLAEARLAAGDPEGCLALADSLGGPDLSCTDPWSRVGWGELLTRAELAAGHLAEAAQWAERAAAVATRLGLQGRTGLALLAHAHVRDAEASAEALEIALAAHDALCAAGMAFDAERARLLVGRALAARGETDRAFGELSQAQAEFDKMGARYLVRQAITERRRLAARGKRIRPSTPRAGLDTLTRREMQISLLVAEGMTNRRIARQLRIAEKTVEMHLSNIFAKLSVSSRTAVASVIARRAEDR